jgi:parallel beta-helix repeat protein
MRSLLWLAILLAAGLPASARTIVVHEGESIRAALARASAGDRVEVLPGTYREGEAGDLNALTITRGGIALVGKPRKDRAVVLQSKPGQSYGVWVSPANSAGPGNQDNTEHPACGRPGRDSATLKGFSIRGFTVRGFAKHGVHLACVDGFSIVDNHADQNAVYGLFPVRSKNGVMAGNVVTNTETDAAIYVGQSKNVLITGNVVHDNLLGIEVENSGQCAVIGNHAYRNTMGIFVDILPLLQRGTQRDTLVAFNSVHGNNRPNTAEPGELLSFLPPGIGLLIAGGEGTTVLMNDVRDNGFAGIAVTSLCLGLALQGNDDCSGLDIDPNPVNDRILANRLVRNGNGEPLPDFPYDALRADLIWDRSGKGNCWSGNSFTKSTPPELPACH